MMAQAPAKGDGPLIAVRGLKKYFPIRGGVTGRTVNFIRAVDGVDFEIQKGKTLGLIGESGCGKTTVGRCLLHLLPPTDGEASFEGRPLGVEARPPLLTVAAACFVGVVGLSIVAFVFNVFASAPLGEFAGLGPFVSPGGTLALAAFVGIVAGGWAASSALEAADWKVALLAGFVALAGGAAVPLGLVLGAVGVALVAVSFRSFGHRTTRALRKDMQIVFQDPFGSLNPRMLVSRIISEPLRAFRGEIQDRYPEHASKGRGRLSEPAMAAIAADLIARVGLNPEHLNRFPHEFSGGQRQRICVARALALKPAFIVLDEPTSALDVSVQAQILNMLKELQRERGLTYLFISHHLAVIRHMCDDVAVMYLGKIVEQAANETLFEETAHPYTIALLSAIPSVDPESRRERIVLKGEIPSPANPPSGCRFHTRCNFALERQVVEFDAVWDDEEEGLINVSDPLAAPLTVRLVVGGEEVDPFAVRGAVAYDVKEGGEGTLAVRVRARIKPGTPARVRYQRYREACVTQEPELLEVSPGHKAACHFKDEARDALRRATAEGRPVGSVVSEMRAPIPVAPTAAAAAPSAT